MSTIEIQACVSIECANEEIANAVNAKEMSRTATAVVRCLNGTVMLPEVDLKTKPENPYEDTYCADCYPSYVTVSATNGMLDAPEVIGRGLIELYLVCGAAKEHIHTAHITPPIVSLHMGILPVMKPGESLESMVECIDLTVSTLADTSLSDPLELMVIKSKAHNIVRNWVYDTERAPVTNTEGE